jgi:hypothetical protein
VVTLTRLLGAAVAWVTATRRRMVAAVAIPVLAVIAVAGPRTPDIGRSVGLDASASTAPTAGGTVPAGGGGGVPGGPQSGLPTPTTVTVGPSDSPRPDPVLPAGPRDVAVAYVTTVNSHDARPGHDRDFLDSYRRARPYVTPDLYERITSPRSSGDYQWTTWTAQRATVAVRIDRVAVPDGAPLPTPTTVYVRVRFTQTATPHVGDADPVSDVGEVTMVTTRQRDGRWLVSQLLVA